MVIRTHNLLALFNVTVLTISGQQQQQPPGGVTGSQQAG